jgi:dTDP-glucose pyrophosphorylase
MKDFTKNTIDKDASCLDALKKLEQETSHQTLFVINDFGILLGTVTDGDIRRGLIRGLTIETPIFSFSYPNFKYLNDEVDVLKIKKLRSSGIKLLPKLNASGQIEKIYDLTRLKSILPLHAVIMAGGKGQRLLPLTEKTPKSMLPLGSKPIIEHNIDQLISYGIEKITISVRYLSDQIMNYFGDGTSKGIAINYIEEEDPLGTIGCLAQIGEIRHESVLLLNSDVFTNIDFEAFFLDFETSGAEMAVASIPYTVDIPYAIMELNENLITSFKEKPKHTYYANAGIYLIRKKSLDYIPKETFFNATDLMAAIIEHGGKLIHSPITGYWIDIGKHDDYRKAQEIVRHL